VLETIGYDPSMAGWAAAADTLLGRVVRVDRGVAGVLTERGLVRAGYGAGVLSSLAADPTAAPCTGDWCVLRDWPDSRVTLERLLPRRTALVRAVAGEQSHGQVLCANADLVGIVVSLQPEPSLARVERMVTLAWDSGARPVVVLAKADLAPDAALLAEDVGGAVPDVPVVTTSTVTGTGMADLARLLDGRLTMALVGASGHGKSSLVNSLVGAAVLHTREIRADGRGRHTSVRRELVPVPGGGALIDTPGLRGVGLTGEPGGLAATYQDVELLAAQCRFRDCTHGEEPGCAVREALAEGRLSIRRFESWQKLRRESEWMAARKDARLMAERTRKWKALRRRQRRSGS
jgi:ribosome biogenesis GTPase